MFLHTFCSNYFLGHGHSHSLFNGVLDQAHGHGDHCHSHELKHGAAHSHDHAHGHGHFHSHGEYSQNIFKWTAFQIHRTFV